MNELELKNRTKQFALRALRLIDALPRTVAGTIVANQLGRCATSVGANYRAACRARSKPEFISKIGIVEEEADESCYWLELIIEGSLMDPRVVRALLKEGNDITAIMTASRKTAQSNQKSKIKNQK